METLGERVGDIARERILGVPLRDLGARHGLSHEGVRQIAQRSLRREIDRIELDLLAGKATGELVGIPVPLDDDEALDFALAWVRYVLQQLREREVEVRVHARAIDAALVFALEDTSDYSGKAQR